MQYSNAYDTLLLDHRSIQLDLSPLVSAHLSCRVSFAHAHCIKCTFRKSTKFKKCIIHRIKNRVP